ncbi:hypothetical protein CLV56_2335 [Mumia flava]|uniref:Ribonuclease VapC n=1 Tax=Mumia flava TaxID=1348852 RepID=A0A0B2BVB5_9ACTN|nr:TA system VapC family ribonuclease toxin [Mumia flava]PJJ58090.1 hypothetical protein CLV56_2335 [Mumia flava]
MNVVDANVLLALYRPDHPHHDVATAWWSDSARSGEPVTVPDLIWVAFARIVTNRRVFPVPATFAQAWRFAETVMRQPTYLTYSGDVRALREFARIARASGASANLVTDVYVAATATALGARVVTFDRDFRKFDGVRVTELGA